MAKYTKLQGFFNGANQVVDYVKSSGKLISQKEYDIVYAKQKKEAKEITQELDQLKQEDLDMEDDNDPRYESWNKRNQEANARKDAWYKRDQEMIRRKSISDNFEAFKNYTVQMQKFYNDKKKTFTRNEIDQLMANNKEVRKLDIFHDIAKYGKEGKNAIYKFTQLMMENDYKKLQYIKSLPSSALGKVNMEQLNKVSLPRSEHAHEVDFDKLKKNVKALAERLKETDANRHVNSLEFRRMKNAMNALSQTLSKPFGGPDSTHKYDIGEKLEALQAAAMDYVKAKGVGRQSSQLGKDRMALALDIIEKTGEGMDKFASRERLHEVSEFEEKVVGREITKEGVLKDFTYTSGDLSMDADIFKSEAQKKAEEAELDDDDDELDDDDDLDLD